MTFAKALVCAKNGKAIRTPDMGDGWCFIWSDKLNILFARNPCTGSLTAQSYDTWKDANNWYEVTL